MSSRFFVPTAARRNGKGLNDTGSFKQTYNSPEDEADVSRAGACAAMFVEATCSVIDLKWFCVLIRPPLCKSVGFW